MPAAEFEKTVLRGGETSKAFVKEMAAQGIDGEKLLQFEWAGAYTAAQMPIGRYELLYEGEEVLDKESHLIWKRCANGMKFMQHRRIGEPYGNCASAGGLPSPARDTPWRLPTQAELRSLVLRQNPNEDRSKSVVDEAAFPDTPQEKFEATDERGSVMPYVDFSSGRSGASRPLCRYLVRFVRDAPDSK
jgi:hypothetical protein